MDKGILLQSRNLKKHFSVQKGFFSRSRGVARAVDGVDLTIHKGETMALVGESGCGKSTVARILIGLITPTEGSVTIAGHDVSTPDGAARDFLSRNVQMIFQDVYASLNPRKTVRHILSQPFLIHKICSREEVDGRVMDLLETVELTPAENFLDRFPHEFSGGQKQRIAIARAIALHPLLIIADEPVSGLDMSVKASILKLMRRLQAESNQSYLFVSHDLAIVRSIAARVAVMYLGKKVEEARTAELFESPLHPYTETLLAATPIPNPRLARQRQRIPIVGEIPSAMNPPSGCRFHTRCSYSDGSRCESEEPPLRALSPDRFVACHYAEELQLRGVLGGERTQTRPLAAEPETEH